jgi:peptide/nickel transport system permease protein
MSKPRKAARPSLIRLLLRSKMGLIGVVIILILATLTLYSIFALPTNLPQQWNNGDAWILYPINAPPAWVSIFGANVAPTLDMSLSNWSTQTYPVGNFTYYIYTAQLGFTWSTSVLPQNIAFIPSFQGNASSVSMTWTKPGGASIPITLANPEPSSAYEAQSPSLSQAASNYILTNTKQYYSQLSKGQVVSAFFGAPGASILNSTAQSGKYSVSVQVLATTKLNMSSSTFDIVGTSYGLMGTDYQGKPIDLGMLAGLPNALEVGFFVAVVSTVSGIIFGGLSGYLGGRKDSIMQWVTLVVLAMPVINFLVVMSFVVGRLSIAIEVSLIAALSWPFFAIIARTVALSIRSQTFVEADKAMGVPAYKVFFSHFMPRLVPVTVAYTVLGIPAGILLAEGLSFIGIVPPNIITWGGILDDAFVNQAAVFGYWWWVVFPGLMIILSAVPFVMIGFALERIIAPRVAAK